MEVSAGIPTSHGNQYFGMRCLPTYPMDGQKWRRQLFGRAPDQLKRSIIEIQAIDA